MATMPTAARALAGVEDRTNGDLVIRDLTVAYPQKVVLRGVNARITRGKSSASSGRMAGARARSSRPFSASSRSCAGR